MVEDSWDKLQKAVDREASFEQDGLIAGDKLQNWADSVMRPGKLADVNILYHRALRSMGGMAAKMSEKVDADPGFREQKKEEARAYFAKARAVKDKINATFWDEEGGYYRAEAEEGSDRFDTPANIFACLYLVDTETAVRIQDSMKARVTAQNGLLKNFDPPYPSDMIANRYKVGQIEDYHNNFTWPWVTNENILAKLKIARDHNDEAVRERFRNEALADFERVSEIFQQNRELNEILDPDSGRPIERAIKLGPIAISTYKSSPSFLATAASYDAAKHQLQELGLLSAPNTG